MGLSYCCATICNNCCFMILFCLLVSLVAFCRLFDWYSSMFLLFLLPPCISFYRTVALFGSSPNWLFILLVSVLKSKCDNCIVWKILSRQNEFKCAFSLVAYLARRKSFCLCAAYRKLPDAARTPVEPTASLCCVVLLCFGTSANVDCCFFGLYFGAYLPT